ncbi:protein disulfide-isomerase A5 [Aplysia californica]|uniref:Protein disulfide-isomerase A5 n=1 Tax=Aplysia californica TaxID=6500 RepID=A0ABM0JHY7_APLCA|nr:protein disulfide-isomerase A5 [Aplysia californica]
MAAPMEKTILVFISIFVLLLMVPYYSHAQNKKNHKSLIIRVEDFKEFKKLLRTKTNLLVICAESEKATAKVMKLFDEVAQEMKGKATLAYVNCGEDKKFCKKLKFSPTAYDLRHYKDGEFNKEYDRKLAVKSMVNFLLDPTGDLPWEEDPTANDVVHISSEEGFNKLLKKTKNPILVMFYAPWCGFCKRLKPDYSGAATELKNKYTLVGVDVDKPPMMSLRMQYNITGFPTLIYFEKGKVKYKYGGENNKAGIVSWMKDPQPPKEPEKEAEWADEKSEVVHLTDSSFEEFVKQNPSVLVMFYAPWCGHCKKMKPGYTEAAQQLKDEGITGILAAVDATKEKKIAQDNGVKGFPTVRYFKDGEYAFEVNERDKDKIIEFMKDPKEPPPPPPPEPKWEEVESEVVHLTDDSFKGFLKKKKHCLIMFYAPWCGHCKKAKPEFMSAAEKFKEDTKVAFAAVDCTSQTGSCSSNDVTGYPTFKYFNYGKNSQKYMGGRNENDFVAFMNDPLNPAPTPAPPAVQSMDEQWRDFAGYESLALLSASNFELVVAESSQLLVMFYAPWCGHCKKMKPAYAEAAAIVEREGLGTLGAVDVTVDGDLGSQYNVKGFPTLKFFKNGQVTDYNSGRSQELLVKFMRSQASVASEKVEDEEDAAEALDMAPKQRGIEEPRPSAFVPSRSVQGLVQANFSQYLNDKQAALVMFYDPDCQYCNQAKPHFMKVAKTLQNKQRGFGSVDCTQEKGLCELEKVTGYPTFKLYVGGKFLSRFAETPNAQTMIRFVENAPVAVEPTPDEKPSGSRRSKEDL